MAMMVMMATIMFNGEPVLTNLVISAISSPAASLQLSSIVMRRRMGIPVNATGDDGDCEEGRQKTFPKNESPLEFTIPAMDKC